MNDRKSGLRVFAAHPKAQRISPFFKVLRSAASPSYRLILFAYAGGSANIFQPWASHTAPNVDVWAVELPGRGERFGEEPFRRVAPLVSTLVAELTPWLDVEYAFFGHSMGAAVAFELAHESQRRRLRKPTQLFLSGRRAPHMPARKPDIHLLNDVEFRNQLRRLQGTPAELLENDELMNLVMPCLRADFELAETYARAPDSLFDTPIHVFGGDADPEITSEELEGWSLHTTRFKGVKLFSGGHFFLTKHPEELMYLIQGELYG